MERNHHDELQALRDRLDEAQSMFYVIFSPWNFVRAEPLCFVLIFRNRIQRQNDLKWTRYSEPGDDSASEKYLDSISGVNRTGVIVEWNRQEIIGDQANEWRDGIG